MKDPCRICGGTFRGNQCRWIFSSSGKRNLQVILSYVLGVAITRDGKGEFLCSKCVFMLENVVNYDVIIGRLQGACSLKVQKLLTEKDNLAQCINHIYNRNNPRPIKSNGEYLSTEKPPVTFNTGIPEEGTLEADSCSGSINPGKDVAAASSTASEGNKMKRCPSSETLRGHEQSGCPNPRRSGSGSPFKTSYLKPVHSRSQSIYFNLVQRTCSTPGSFHSQSSSLQSCCAESCSHACSSTSLSVLGLKTKGAHGFDNFSELPARSSFISSPSVCDAIKLLKSVQCKPLLILPESKIPVLLKYAQRRPASGCSYLYRKTHDTERIDDWKFLQDLAEDFNDEYTPLKAESLAEKHKELSNLEAATRQLTGDLESTRMMIDTLKKRLEEADEDNKNLNGRLEERVNELALEKKNSLKRDKTIQGLSLVLKDKDKEIEELCHEIEDRDNALVKAREAAHKAQIQKYQGAEEHQSLLTEKEAELAKLLSDHHANTMENQKLQRALGRRVQELSDLNQTKEQLEKELEDMQELKNKGDKDVNDLRNQLKKLNGEMAEKEHALEQQYQALLSESKQKVQSQEITIKRLTSSLNEKDELLQEYLNMAKDADQERNRSPDGRDAMLAKLRERLKEKEKALEQAIDEKFAAIEEKDNEIRQLQLSLREKERDLERLNNLLSHNEETINSFDSVIKEKDVELQHLVNSCKNLQRAKQELEDNLARALREKDAIISQLQQSLANKNKDMEEMANTLLNQTQSNVRDLTEQLRQRLKVTETMLAEAMKDKERLVSENQNAVEGLLATVGSKDQLLKESAEHYNRTLAERNLEIQDLRRHLSEKKHEVSILEKHSSVITHEKYIETAELKVLLTEKDTIINKLVESGQERDKYLAELKMQEAPIPQVLELKQTIQILQEQLEDKEAELTQKKGDVNVAKIPIIKKSAVTLKKELAQKTDDLNKALKKENELQIEVAELRSLLADLENRHEAQAANIESLTKTLDVKDEIIRDLHTRLGKPPKHKGVELQTQRGVVTREGIQSPGIPQRESTIIGGNSQQEALPALQTVLSEYDTLNKALKAEQQLYSSLVRTVKEPDSAQRIHNLQMELTAVQLLRQKLEEGIRSNEDLRKDLEKELQRTKRKEVTDAQTGLIDPREMETLKHQLEDAQRWNTSLQARLGKIQGRGGGVGGTNDTSDTFSFTGDQTSYMSIYLGEHDELEGDIENLSLPELRRKVQELLEYVKELQAFNKDFQNKASLTENSVEQDKQDILTLSSQNKLLEKKLADAVKTNKALHDQLNREGQKSAQNVIKPQVKDQKIQTSPEKERNSKASPQGNRAEHQGNKSSGIKPPGRKESTSASPDSEKTELDLEDQNVVETELKETSCRMETIGKELKTAEKPPCKDEGNNQNMEMEIASLRSLLTETGSASVIELRNELARLNNENTNLQSILKEMQSTEFKESCDDSGDGEIKKDLKKVVKRLKTELMDARKIIKLLKEQLELNSSMDNESSFNPDLIVSMAKEIDHLKKEHEASTKRRVILEKMLKEMEAQQPRGIDERDQRRNSQETLQRQEARIHSTPGSTIGAKSRLPVPVKSSKAAGNNNNNGANQNTEPDPQVEKLQSALQEKNKEYRELQESLCTAEFTLTRQKVNKTEATQTTDPSTDFNLYKQIDQLQKALQEKNQLNKELQELLCKAESALASQNTDRTGHLYKDLDHQQEQQEEKLQQALLVDQLQKGLQERNALNRQLEDRLSGAEACLNVNRTSASTNTDLDLHQLQKALQEKNQINKDLLERLHGAESIIEHLNGNKGVANQNEDMELHQQVNQLQKSLREKRELNKKLEERLSEAESTLTVLNANGASSSTNIDLDLRQLQKVLHEKNQINKDLLERLHKAESTIEHLKSSRAVANPNTDVSLYLQIDQLQKAILEKKQLYKELQELLQTAASTLECHNATGTLASPNKELDLHQQVDQLQKALEEKNCLHKELHELLRTAQLTIACLNANCTSTGPNADLELHQQLDQLQKGLQEKNELNKQLEGKLSGSEACQNAMRTSASTNTDLQHLQKALQEKNQINKDLLERLHKAESTIEHLNANRGVTNRNTELEVHQQIEKQQKAIQELNELNKQLEEKLFATEERLNENRTSASTNTNLDLQQLQKALEEKNHINKELLESLHRAESTIEDLTNNKGVDNWNTDGDLHRQVGELQKALNEKNKLNKQLEERLSEAESTFALELYQLQKDLQEKTEINKELQERLHAAESIIECLNDNPNPDTHLHQMVDQLRKTLQEKNQFCEKLKERLFTAESTTSHLNPNRAVNNENPDMDHLQQVDQLQKALQEKTQIIKQLQQRLHTAELALTHLNANRAVTKQSANLDLQKQVDQLQKALQQKMQINQELQQRLGTAESTIAHQNSNKKMHEAGTFLEQDDKEVQVDLQDLGYETCGKSENEVDREENRSTDNNNQIKQHMNEASLPSLLKRDGQFFSMENLDTNSSTSYPSSSCLSSPKISMKSLQIYDDYGFTDDSDELKQQVMELKTKLENYQRVIHHLQSLLRRNSLSSDLLTIGSEPGQQTTVKLQEEHGDLEKDGQEMCSHKSLGLFSLDHSQNGSFPLGHDGEDKQMLKDEITSLKIELDKEKASNKNLLEQLHQLQSKIRSASPARFDSLVQSQARELSHLRQKIKDSRSLGTLHHHQLEDLNKSFEELLQASDVDYYVGKAFRGQLDKSLLVLGKLEERLECGDGYSDNEDNTLLEFAERLSREVQEKNKVIQQLQLQVRNKSVELSTSHNSSDSEASDRYSRRILDSGSDTLHALQCRDGKYGQGRTSAGTKVPYGLQVEETAQPPGIISASTGKATVLGKENGGGSRRQSQTLLSTDTQILENKGGLPQRQCLQGLQRENSLLQEKLKNSEQLNETLRAEVDLHRSIINNREDAGEERGLSPKPLDRSSREDRASTGLTESRNEPSGLVNTDLLAEHLQEIRSLRQRLEESIRTNDRLREQLERRLAEAEPDPASTNIFIHGSEEQGQLANEVHFLWRQNQTLKDQLSLGSRDKQKENEKLRESLAKRNSKLEYLRNEYEHVKKEAVRLENKFRGSLEENKHLKEALHHSRDEINRLQSEIGIQRQQLSDSQHLLQSLRVELQVYEQLKVASDKRTVSDATSGQTQDASAPSHGPLDLSELLSEIRHLRIQLERSIETNNALRQRLEEQLLRGQGKVEGSPSTININYLLSGEQRHSTLSSYGDNGSKSPAQDENFPHPSYRGSSKSGRSPPNRDGAKASHGVPEMKPHSTDELDSASQCSGSSADSTTHTPSRLVPGHRLWASRSGRHILGLIEDYNALRKQISEGKVLTCGMENNLQECFHAISQQGTESMVLDQRFLKGFSSDVNTMQQILEEASRLLKLLWKVSLPTNTSNSSSQNRQDEMMKTEIARLRSKLSQQERMLNGTVKRLRSTNRLKEGMEKVIIDQLAVTHNVLKKARGNLEIQPLQEASVNGN